MRLFCAEKGWGELVSPGRGCGGVARAGLWRGRQGGPMAALPGRGYCGYGGVARAGQWRCRLGGAMVGLWWRGYVGVTPEVGGRGSFINAPWSEVKGDPRRIVQTTHC